MAADDGGTHCSHSASLRSRIDLVDHGLSQRLQHLPLVVIKVSVDLVDGTVLHHPQLALSLCDESGIVTHNDHSWTETETMVIAYTRAVYRRFEDARDNFIY